MVFLRSIEILRGFFKFYEFPLKFLSEFVILGFVVLGIYCTNLVPIRVDELGTAVFGEHVDDDHLTPFLHVNQQTTQFPIVFMDQVEVVGANFLERLDGASRHELQNQIVDVSKD